MPLNDKYRTAIVNPTESFPTNKRSKTANDNDDDSESSSSSKSQSDSESSYDLDNVDDFVLDQRPVLDLRINYNDLSRIAIAVEKFFDKSSKAYFSMLPMSIAQVWLPLVGVHKRQCPPFLRNCYVVFIKGGKGRIKDTKDDRIRNAAFRLIRHAFYDLDCMWERERSFDKGSGTLAVCADVNNLKGETQTTALSVLNFVDFEDTTTLIAYIATDVRYQRMGLASFLMVLLAKRIKHQFRSPRDILLRCNMDDKANLQFFVSLKFEIIAESDVPKDVIKMRDVPHWDIWTCSEPRADGGSSCHMLLKGGNTLTVEMTGNNQLMAGFCFDPLDESRCFDEQERFRKSAGLYAQFALGDMLVDASDHVGIGLPLLRKTDFVGQNPANVAKQKRTSPAYHDRAFVTWRERMNCKDGEYLPASMLQLAIAWHCQFQLNSLSSSITVVPLNIASHVATMCKIYNWFLAEQQLDENEQEGLLFSTDEDEQAFKESFQHVARFIFMNRDMFEKNYIFIFDVENDTVDSANVSAFVAVNPTLEKQKVEKDAPIRGFFRYNPLWNDDQWKDPPPVEISDSGPLFFLSIAKCLLFNKTWQRFSVQLRGHETNSLEEYTLASKFASYFGNIESFHQWYQEREDPFVSKGKHLFDGSKKFVQLTLPRTFPLKCGENEAFQGPVYSFLFLINVCHSLSNKKMHWLTGVTKKIFKNGKYQLEIPEEYDLSSYWKAKIPVTTNEGGPTNEPDREVYGKASGAIVHAVRLTIISLVDRIAFTNAGMQEIQEHALYKRMLTSPKEGVIQPYDTIDFGTVIGDMTQLCCSWAPLLPTSSEDAGMQNNLPVVTTAQTDAFDNVNDDIPEVDVSRKQSQVLAPGVNDNDETDDDGKFETEDSEEAEEEKKNEEMDKEKKKVVETNTKLLSTGLVLPLTPPKKDEGLRKRPRQRDQILTTLSTIESVLPSVDLFKKDFKSSASEKDKSDVLWKALRFAHETSPIAAVTEFMNTMVAKLDESSAVVADYGEKDIVERRYTKATAFHERVSAFVEGYSCAPAKSKIHFLVNTVLTLRGEGFRFLEKATGGGYQEMDLNSSCRRVQKRILYVLALRSPTATTATGAQDAATAATGTGTQDSAATATGNPTNMESVLETPFAPLDRALGPFHEPGAMDIVPGCTKAHPANLTYRQRLANILDEFEVASKKEKVMIMTRFIAELRREGYRFVEQSSSQGFWSELELRRAIQKVRHSMRDIASRKRKKEGSGDDYNLLHI
jgi:hypothetical protein